jgi:ATP-dependent DNA helicase HFM1/MER3
MMELEESSILQMIGRAGRPQFDDSGVAVILTRSDKRVKYEHIVAGKQPLESRLHLQLVEHINAEIGLRTIMDIQSAKIWLRSTYFFIRCRLNPTHYGVSQLPDAIDGMVEEKCVQSMEILQKEGLVENIDGTLQTTAYGGVAARYCVRFSTITRIMGTKGQAKLKDVVRILL